MHTRCIQHEVLTFVHTSNIESQVLKRSRLHSWKSADESINIHFLDVVWILYPVLHVLDWLAGLTHAGLPVLCVLGRVLSPPDQPSPPISYHLYGPDLRHFLRKVGIRIWSNRLAPLPLRNVKSKNSPFRSRKGSKSPRFPILFARNSLHQLLGTVSLLNRYIHCTLSKNRAICFIKRLAVFY